MFIASMTTIPERLHAGLAERCIQSLLAQSRRPDLVLVNVPRESLKGMRYDDAKANELESLLPGVVVVNWVSRDWGPITKLLGALEYMEARPHLRSASATNIWLMLADDDCSYRPWVAGHLLDEARRQNKRAVGFAGRSPRFGIWGNVASAEWLSGHYVENVAFLETYAGVLYDVGLFAPLATMWAWIGKLPPNCLQADDILIGAWINRMPVVPVQSILSAEGKTDSYIHDAGDTPELRNQNVVGDNNVQVLQHLMDHLEFRRWHTPMSKFRADLLRPRWIALQMLCVVFAIVFFGCVLLNRKNKKSKND